MENCEKRSDSRMERGNLQNSSNSSAVIWKTVKSFQNHRRMGQILQNLFWRVDLTAKFYANRNFT